MNKIIILSGDLNGEYIKELAMYSIKYLLNRNSKFGGVYELELNWVQNCDEFIDLIFQTLSITRASTE